jgi:PAS domain S-box-containing protein
MAEEQKTTPDSGYAQSRFWSDGSTSLLEAIIRSSDDAIVTKNLDGIITSWNPAAVRMFGYLPEEVLGQSILKLIPPSLQSEEPEILRKLRAGEQIAHYETTRLTKSGEERLVSLTISPVRDENARVIGASKIIRDITDQKQLDHVRFQLAAIVESSDDAILTKDLTGRITSWNGAAARVFGYSEAEIVGSSILTLIPEELHSEEWEILAKLQAGQRIDHYETTRLKKNGERIDVSLTISPLRNAAGTIIGASKVLRDISGRKRIEQSLMQAEKIAATGRMAATMAHEINNPLEAVLNLIYLARLNASDPEQVREFLTAAEDELTRVSHIARQALGYYREHASEQDVSLAELVQEALRVYEPKLRAAGIRIQSKFAPAPTIVLRRGEITQVISNLITNAMYAMPSGGSLMISVEETTVSSRNGLILMVEDNGVGIPSENLEKIFEPFFTTRNAIGTGIGLWVTKQFIEGHSGNIEVRSSIDSASHGTKMLLFLPFVNSYSSKVVRHREIHSTI